MIPFAWAIPAPIPLAFDVTIEFGSVLLVVLLALLDIGAVVALRTALTARSAARSRGASTGRTGMMPLGTVPR